MVISNHIPSQMSVAATATATLFLLVALLCSLRLLFGGGLRSPEKEEKKQQRRRPPVAGTVFHQLKNLNRLYHYQTDLSRRYRTFRILAPFRSYIYTADPVNVEYILKTNFSNYGKGMFHNEVLKDLLGDGIFTVDGDKWRHQRKLASHEFSTKVLRDFSSVVFRSKATQLAHIISAAATSKQIFDIQDLFVRSTLDSIFKVGFGVELNDLSEPSQEARAFAKAFDDSSSLTTQRYLDVSWKMKRFLGIGSEAVLKKNIKVIDDFVYKLIRRKSEQLSKQSNYDSLVEREDLLSRFLMEMENGTPEDKRNEKYLRDIILNFIIAGRDTTASTLSSFFFMLCKHPSIQEKVAQDVKEATCQTVVQGRSTNVACDNKFEVNITEEALNNMHYLHAALTETLRLFPPVPLDGKVCFSDDTLPDGFMVKKGDLVDYEPYVMGRMEFLWGKDAEVFCPERWLDGDGVFHPENPFKFTAFQSGPRICLGKEFAYRQMKIFAATLLNLFSFHLSDEQRVVNYKVMITLKIEQGLHLRALHR